MQTTELSRRIGVCASEISQAVRDQKPGDWTSLLWEMSKAPRTPRSHCRGGRN